MIANRLELMGIDYPYWETYGLRSVFPALQDVLGTFPANQIYNQIIQDWRSLRPTMKLVPFALPDLLRKLNILHGAYLLALSKGAAPYELHPRSAPRFQTASFLQTQTGFDRQTVIAFLSTLEKLAKSGKIDSKFYAPQKAIERNLAAKKILAQVKESEPPTGSGGMFSDLKSAGKYAALAVVGVAFIYGLSFLKKAKGV